MEILRSQPVVGWITSSQDTQDTAAWGRPPLRPPMDHLNVSVLNDLNRDDDHWARMTDRTCGGPQVEAGVGPPQQALAIPHQG